MKQIGIWGGVTLAMIAIIWGLIALVNNGNPSQITQTSTPPPLSKDDIVLGNPKEAKVTLIEYADFQCPACANYAPLVKQLGKDFGNDLLIVYRYFPLTSIHKNAMSSSQAAFAAGKQNKFWKMNDLLYENQKSWAEEAKAKDIFTEYAKRLDLNILQFTSDFNSEASKKFVTDEMNSAISIGINSTPTFFINGKQIQNPRSYEAFRKLLQDALDEK